MNNATTEGSLAVLNKLCEHCGTTSAVLYHNHHPRGRIGFWKDFVVCLCVSCHLQAHTCRRCHGQVLPTEDGRGWCRGCLANGSALVLRLEWWDPSLDEQLTRDQTTGRWDLDGRGKWIGERSGNRRRAWFRDRVVRLRKELIAA